MRYIRIHLLRYLGNMCIVLDIKHGYPDSRNPVCSMWESYRGLLWAAWDSFCKFIVAGNAGVVVM